jgi:hypothetical protein
MPAPQPRPGTNKPRQAGQGSSCASPASTARSAQPTRGQATWRRTATSWRHTSNSASSAAELLASGASHRSTVAEQEVEQSQGHASIIAARWLPWRTCSSAPTTEFLAPTGHAPSMRIPCHIGELMASVGPVPSHAPATKPWTSATGEQLRVSPTRVRRRLATWPWTLWYRVRGGATVRDDILAVQQTLTSGRLA